MYKIECFVFDWFLLPLFVFVSFLSRHFEFTHRTYVWNKHTSKRKRSEAAVFIVYVNFIPFLKHLYVGAGWWFFYFIHTDILLTHTYRHATLTPHCFTLRKKNKQYFNPQSSLAAIFNVFSSTVFLLVYLVIGVRLFSELSVFTKFFPTLSRQTKQKQISRYKRQKFIHINIFFPLFI